jgi:hypothetical protein
MSKSVYTAFLWRRLSHRDSGRGIRVHLCFSSSGGVLERLARRSSAWLSENGKNFRLFLLPVRRVPDRSLARSRIPSEVAQPNYPARAQLL